jgi:hypothetical protein
LPVVCLVSMFLPHIVEYFWTKVWYISVFGFVKDIFAPHVLCILVHMRHMSQLLIV